VRAPQNAARRTPPPGEGAGAPPTPATISATAAPATTAAARLVVVCREDPNGRYAWLGPPRPREVLVAFDGLAYADLADRGAVLFDQLQNWEERSAAEHRVNELLAAVRAHPQVAALERDGHRLIDFAGGRLREELTRLLWGWTLLQAAPDAERLVCDRATPPALEMGTRAALGLDPAAVPYTPPPALPGSALKRAVARPAMRAVAARSRPGRVRVAAVAAGKLALALAALPGAELRAMGVGTMPFPGIDHGNSALLALRRRLPMLATFGRPAREAEGSVTLPARLELCREEALDRALGLLVARLLAAAAPELEGVARAIKALERADALRALVLPTAGYGAAQVLSGWARRRGLRVGVMQHGTYSFREGCPDAAADVLFSWGEGTAEQVCAWPPPRPRLAQMGVPGTPTAPPRRPEAPLRRVLIAATNTGFDTPLGSRCLGEEFLDVLAPGLAALATTVELRLRPHPTEDPARYRRLLARRGLPATVTAGGLFAAAATWADLVIASGSSAAFEAAVLGLPVLLWPGGAPLAVREEHLVAPWSSDLPGMFGTTAEFSALAARLLEQPAAGLAVAHELRRELARYAQPFDAAAFAAGLRLLGA
jgi:hypothetical protein